MKFGHHISIVEKYGLVPGQGVCVFDPVTGTMMALTAAGAATSAAGTIMSGNAAAQGGQIAKNAEDFKAAQLNQQAVQSRAVAQRQALETGRKTTFALSSLQAGAAASGGGASDEGVTVLASDIAGRGKYLSLADMYQGENTARGLEAQAEGATYTGEADLFEGEQKQSASRYTAAGTILGGAGSMFKQYGDMTYQQNVLSNPDPYARRLS